MLDIETIKSKAVPILKKFNVVQAYIFGSFARNEQNQDSDIDLIIIYDPEANVSLFDHIDLKYSLENALQRKVDIVTEAAISKHIRPYVLKDRKVIM
ncbi:MAG: nucleotidyltransferase domain-containing protein [Desulfotomaculum sp.]|nr:nucleotidyltransferase domain-containing protein [Desulfotomaculum sp.]